MFLAASYYDDQQQPSQFSAELFSRLFAFANSTQNRYMSACSNYNPPPLMFFRVPLSDWTMTEVPDVAGFAARPVYGAM
jgi:hypothetical protein